MPSSVRSSMQSVLCRCTTVLAVALAASPLAAAAPRWTPVGPPAAPPAARLFFDPAGGGGGRGYALTEAGLWRSPSLGSWRNVQAGLDGTTLAFAFDPRRPGRLYASVGELDGTTSVRRSDDFGDHWSVVFRLSYDTSWQPQDLQVDPSAPDTVYWLANSFLSRSEDGGRTWTDLGNADSFALAPGQPGTLYVISGASFYTSVDGGQTWSEPTLIENQYQPEAIAATRAPGTLYVWSRDPYYRGNYSPCFMRSSDGGATWKDYLPQTQCGAPAIDPNDPLTVRIVVVAGMAPQLWVSHDGGESWSVAGAVPAVGDLYALPAKGLALATGQGVFRTAADQGPWQPANHGFAAAEVGAILPTQRGLFAAAALPTFGPKPPEVPLLLTADGGRTWSGSPLTNPIALAADPGDPHRVLASALRFEGWGVGHARVLESLDGGITWRGVVDPQVELPETFLRLAADPFDRQTLYAGAEYGGFYRSDDGGRTWHDSNSGLVLGGCHHYYCESNRVSGIVPDPRKNGGVAILFERQVYASDDGGLNWKVRGPVPRQRYGFVIALTRDPQGALVALTGAITARDEGRLGLVYRSTDEGLTWALAGRLPRTPSGTEATAFAASPAGLFAGTRSMGVLRSTDGGRTWTPLSAGLPLPAVTSLAADPVDPARLYATVPQNGVYTIRVP